MVALGVSIKLDSWTETLVHTRIEMLIGGVRAIIVGVVIHNKYL